MSHEEEGNDARLRALAQRLGTGAADRLDVERTAQAVVARLRQERGRVARRWTWTEPAWLRVAAVVLVLVGGGALLRPWKNRAPAGAVWVESGGVELSDLSTAQLREVLDSVGQLGEPEPVPAQEVGLDDLSAPQLRALLASLES